MKLHENKELFRQAVQATAQWMVLQEIFVEKDYWVTLALHSIFHDPIGSEAVFKGGTALSKCFHLIDRFSEDIDLVILRRAGETDNQRKAKIKKITQAVSRVIPEEEMEGITNKKGMNRKTAHHYSRDFSGDFGQVRDRIIVEASWLGHHEPFRTMDICTYIHDMMVKIGQGELSKAI